MPSRPLVFYLLFHISLIASPGTQSKNLANEIMIKFQKKFEATKSFEAQFVQTVFSKAFGTSDISKGTVYVLKPNRFRWESTSEGSIQIINGKKMTYIQPKARNNRTVVTIYEDFTKQADPKFLEFLTGKIKLKAHYRWSLVKNKKASVVVKLTPQKKGAETYIAEIDKTRYFLTALGTDSADAKTDVVFSQVRLNSDPEPKLFEYQIKSDDIVHKQ